MKLVNRLEKTKSKTMSSEEKFLTDVKLLVDETSSKEQHILSQLGLDFQVKEIQRQGAEVIRRKETADKFKSNCYTLDEIQDLCIKYNLRFLKTQKYKGKISSDTGAVLARFCEKYNVPMGENGYSGGKDRFFIAAPGKAFNLKSVPPPKMPKLEMKLDPLLFYNDWIFHNCIWLHNSCN